MPHAPFEAFLFIEAGDLIIPGGARYVVEDEILRDYTHLPAYVCPDQNLEYSAPVGV